MERYGKQMATDDALLLEAKELKMFLDKRTETCNHSLRVFRSFVEEKPADGVAKAEIAALEAYMKAFRSTIVRELENIGFYINNQDELVKL